MRKSRHAAGVLSMTAVLAAGLSWARPALAKPHKSHTFTSVNNLGDVSQSKRPARARFM